MDKKWMRQTGGFLFALVCMLLAALVPVEAATLQSDAEIRAAMNQAFANGEPEVSLTIERTFSVDEYQAKREAESYADELIGMLEEEALKNGKLMKGTSYIWRWAGEAENIITYSFDISSQYTKKVTRVTSEKSAYKYALKALRDCSYTKNFYAEDAMYHDTFVLAMQHHPEYAYDLVIWKSSDGTFGYRPGGELSAAAIKSKMKKADAAADAIIKKIIKKSMTKKQKLQAIHDYLVKNCVYDQKASAGSYNDAFTAYGCLIKKKAVCQGYAAAFNLLAMKVGVPSIAVSGEAGGGSHAWNFVKCSGLYRYIDTTWDDPLPDRGSKAKVSQKYFYLTQSQLAKKHIWDKAEHAKKYVDYASVLL